MTVSANAFVKIWHILSYMYVAPLMLGESQLMRSIHNIDRSQRISLTLVIPPWALMAEAAV